MSTKLPNFDSFAKEVTSGNVSFERLQELSQKNIDLARLIADNPASPPELLRTMAKRRDNLLLENVTANPNTPTEVLFKLGKRFPKQFIKNPILSLLLLENPDFLREMPIKVLYSLRDYILEQYYSNSADQQVQTYNGLAPDFVLQQLLKHQDSSLRYCIAKHPNTPLTILEQLAADKVEYLRYGVALNPNAPVHVLEKLAEDESNSVRIHVARNPCISTELILKFANDPNIYVNEAVVCNPQAPKQIIDTLLDKFKHRQNCEYTLARIAASDLASIYVLKELSTCDIRKVRSYVGGNKRTPQETLKEMALVKNEHWLVLKEIAKNLATPIKVLQKMTQEHRISIREAALDNLRTSDKLRASLLAKQR